VSRPNSLMSASVLRSGGCSAYAKLYARDGRPSIPPERLLRGLLLQALGDRCGAGGVPSIAHRTAVAPDQNDASMAFGLRTVP
jgi:hypothetical protein